MSAEIIALASRRDVRRIYADQLQELAAISVDISKALAETHPDASRRIARAALYLAAAYEDLLA